MPNAVIKSYAKKSGKSRRKIESYWDDAKVSAKKAGFSKDDPAFWAYTNAIVQRRSGLHEGETFKEFLMHEGVDDLKHKVELGKTGFYGKAGAGCIIMARSTGRLLMPKRSQDVEQPGTYGTWGGAIDESEDPATAALREVHEESGYKGSAKMIPLLVFKHPSGFRYYNFLAIVKDEFEPKLDWETESAKWCDLNKLPRPLHFGLKSVLEDPSSMATLKREVEATRT